MKDSVACASPRRPGQGAGHRPGIGHLQLYADTFAEWHETEELCEMVRRQTGHRGSSAPESATVKC